jgi:Holliday junction DNA helicase RuvB
MLSSPMRDRFGMILRLDYYNDREMQEIIMRSSSILKLNIDVEAADQIAKRSRKTPRIANRILKRARDLYEVEKHSKITLEVAQKLFDILALDEAGLSNADKDYLKVIIEKFDGGPVGVSTLSTSLGEDAQTIEEFIEPYLIQLCFIKKTPRGRVTTDKAHTHLKLRKKESNQERLV